MGYVNIIQLRKELAVGIKQLQPLATQAAQRKFNRIKKTATEEFENNDVTTEIEAGPDTTSTVLDDGPNLFALLGFYRSDRNPIKDLRLYLYGNINFFPHNPTITRYESFFNYNFSTEQPSYSDLQKETPLTWANGRSWLDEVENGISGLAYYVFIAGNPLAFPPSRSSRGLQLRTPQRSSLNTKVFPYLKGILERLKTNLKEP